MSKELPRSSPGPPCFRPPSVQPPTSRYSVAPAQSYMPAGRLNPRTQLFWPGILSCPQPPTASVYRLAPTPQLAPPPAIDLSHTRCLALATRRLSRLRWISSMPRDRSPQPLPRLLQSPNLSKAHTQKPLPHTCSPPSLIFQVPRQRLHNSYVLAGHPASRTQPAQSHSMTTNCSSCGSFTPSSVAR